MIIKVQEKIIKLIVVFLQINLLIMILEMLNRNFYWNQKKNKLKNNNKIIRLQ